MYGTTVHNASILASGEYPAFALSRFANAGKGFPDALSRARSTWAEEDQPKDPRAAAKRLDALTRAVEMRCERLRRELS